MSKPLLSKEQANAPPRHRMPISHDAGNVALINEIYEDIHKVVYVEGHRDEDLLQRTQVPALSSGKLISPQPYSSRFFITFV